MAIVGHDVHTYDTTIICIHGCRSVMKVVNMGSCHWHLYELEWIEPLLQCSQNSLEWQC